MNISNAQAFIYSPTGTTRKIAGAILEGMQLDTVITDRTPPCPPLLMEPVGADIVLVGAPVYAGRIAPLALQRLADLKGEGTLAIAVVLYGNREYEDALLELRDMLTEKGFSVIAAGAFIGEHSYSTDEFPIAQGRPDKMDLKKAREFGKDIMASTTGFATGRPPLLEVPGNSPYKPGIVNAPLSPEIDQEACSQCSTCIVSCPAGAISLEEIISIDETICTLCCACVKACPEQAIRLQAAPIMEKRKKLNCNCCQRKEPALFLADYQ